MIIDFHTHIDEAPAFGWIDPPEKIVALLDEAGIDLAVAMTYTDLPGLNPDALDYILAAVGRFPDRLVAFVRLNPNYRAEAAAFLDKAFERGARGLKLHPTTTLAHPAEEARLLVATCGELETPPVPLWRRSLHTPQTFGSLQRPRQNARSARQWVAT